MAGFTIKVVFAVIGIVVGVSAAVCFGFKFHNPDAGAFGLASAVAATLALTVHILYHRCYWTYQHHGSLVRFMYTGCFIQLIGVIGFVVYVVFGSMQVRDEGKLLIEGRSHFLTCVWCFMTWKWGFLLFYFSRRYLRAIRKGASDLLVQE